MTSSVGFSRARLFKLLGRGLLAVYLVALAASTLYRLTRAAPKLTPGFNEKFIEIPEFKGDAQTGRKIRLAFYDYLPPGRSDAPVVVLLHGSPGSAGGFAGIMPQLSGDCPPPGTLGGGFARRPIVCPDPKPANAVRVLAPYLPGYGDSENTIADYSFRAHAQYLRAMLHALGVRRAHFVGYSMGGGPAFNLEDIDPDKVASITLLSSLGVQEFELMGDYHLNRVVHGIQLVPLWMIENLTPHFGALDGFPGVEYALNFFQSDQRPLRPFMLRYEKPLLVIQGLQDAQVPSETAFEHHRIVPHSELLTIPAGGHGMVFSQPAELAAPLLDFVERAERGVAPTRADVTPERVAAVDQRIALAPMIGVATFSFFALIVCAAMISPELGAAVAGALLGAGRAPLLGTGLMLALGILLGELLMRSLTRRAGVRLAADAGDHAPWRWLVTRAAVSRAVRGFERGIASGLMRRVLSGERMAAYLAWAGLRRGWRGALALTALTVPASLALAAALLALATAIAWPLATFVLPVWPSAVVCIVAVLLFGLTALARRINAEKQTPHVC